MRTHYTLIIGKMKFLPAFTATGTCAREICVCVWQVGQVFSHSTWGWHAGSGCGAGLALDASKKIDPHGCRVKGVSPTGREREKWTKKTTKTDTHHAMHAHWQIIINTLVLHVRSPNNQTDIGSHRSSKINKNWLHTKHGIALRQWKTVDWCKKNIFLNSTVYEMSSLLGIVIISWCELKPIMKEQHCADE